MEESIRKKLAEHSQEWEEQLKNTLDRSQFTLYEDLRLIQIQLNEKMKYSHFVHLAQEFGNRTAEDVRNRFIEKLKYLSQEDIQSIWRFVKANNLMAYLEFDGRRLKAIKKVIVAPKTDKKHSGNTSSIAIQTNQTSHMEPRVTKKMKVTDVEYRAHFYELSEMQIQTLYQHEILHQELRFPTSEQLPQCQRYKQEEFQNALHDLSIWYELPLDRLKKLLGQCSGSFSRLKRFLEEKSTQVLWKVEDDERLAAGQEIPQRDPLDVERRKKWLSL